ncbi:tRNA-specific adenosine deaminase [Blastomonas aquatica]|uniref:tRNA-specific adenosine deaminase n=2 Tax=Blastomonas aquatica TaxID=1510276 RepID=A0ABQ1JIH7_9SPHN|nr:tRNA-specific adenosine deaminase [Blastomonas aquatica]
MRENCWQGNRNASSSLGMTLDHARRLAAHALELAQKAALLGEVPVGAIVVQQGRVIGEGHNQPRALHDPTAHAEIMAIRAACATLGSDRLMGCDLWVTLEPCAMCAGAISHARIARLHYAASDPKGGAVEHGPRLFQQPTVLHKPEVYAGVGEADAAALLKQFFAARR